MELNSSKNKYSISIDLNKIVNAINKYNWVKRNSKKYSFGYVEESKIDDYYYIYISKFSDLTTGIEFKHCSPLYYGKFMGKNNFGCYIFNIKVILCIKNKSFRKVDMRKIFLSSVFDKPWFYHFVPCNLIDEQEKINNITTDNIESDDSSKIINTDNNNEVSDNIIKRKRVITDETTNENNIDSTKIRKTRKINEYDDFNFNPDEFDYD